ncbi:MAG: hypothetical protein AAGE98_01810 [Actinomycetota bacterium]
MSSNDRVGKLGIAWIVGVVAYAILRALIVWPTLGDYGVDPWIFLIIDVGTAWPYAYGQLQVIREARRGEWRSVQIWALITLASFIAPYAYIVGAGSGEMPLLAWIVIGVLVAFLGLASVVRIVRQVRQPVATAPPAH